MPIRFLTLQAHAFRVLVATNSETVQLAHTILRTWLVSRAYWGITIAMEKRRITDAAPSKGVERRLPHALILVEVMLVVVVAAIVVLTTSGETRLSLAALLLALLGCILVPLVRKPSLQGESGDLNEQPDELGDTKRDAKLLRSERDLAFSTMANQSEKPGVAKSQEATRVDGASVAGQGFLPAMEAHASAAEVAESGELAPTQSGAPDKGIAGDVLAHGASKSPAAETHEETPDDAPFVGLDYEVFAMRLLLSGDPLDELKLFVRDVRKRRQRPTDEFPTAYERFVARMLSEAGLFSDDVELPRVNVVRPPASGMIYLRIVDRELPYLAKVRILALEAALNAARLSATYFENPNEHTLVEHYQLLQRLTRSVCAQSPNLSEHVPVIEDDAPDTEWAVRLGISTAIESLQLPHRLEARFRANVADGNVAISITLPPEGAFPGSAYVEGVGLVPSTRDMRRKAASDYALRLVLLVAACAFRCSEKVLHVWVQATQQTATRFDCYLSVDFDRWRFSRLDLADLGDLSEVYRRFAAIVRLEEGILRPVAASFSLEEQRFCPPRRYAAVSLSARRLPDREAKALGTNHVSGLAIDESTKRELVASHIMREVGESTEQNVRTILELAGDDPDPTVRSAAERCVRKLIEGTLEGDASSIGAEFVGGDDLSAAVRAAYEALKNQSFPDAQRLLARALEPYDRAGIYDDSATVEYRHFASYVDRALYNRLFALPGRTALLVPHAYYQAHLLLSASLLMQGDAEGALTHARRLVEVSPLDTRARLHLARCLELSGRMEEAMQALSELLLIAHDPEGLGIGYYRMAFFQWQAGNLLVAQACYLRAMRFLPAVTPLAAMELAALSLQNPGGLHEEMDEDEAEQLMQEHGVPIAPTEQMSTTFAECARAAIDAEVFPVARNFGQVLATFEHDDILMGLIHSLEDAPDL